MIGYNEQNHRPPLVDQNESEAKRSGKTVDFSRAKEQQNDTQ